VAGGSGAAPDSFRFGGETAQLVPRLKMEPHPALQPARRVTNADWVLT
jgi:hypothetical protein